MATKHTVQFDDEQMQQYSDGKELPADENFEQRYYIIQWNGFGMGTTKKVDNYWKNKM